jgi:nitrilase
MNPTSTLKIALTQISPIWLNKEKTIDKIKSFITDAGTKNF